MSRRHSRRRRTGRSPEEPASGVGPTHVEQWPDGEWTVRPVAGSATAKSYRCPGCDQEIRPATPHIVAWPAAGPGGIEDRRHWHPSCWRKRMDRAPKLRRSRGAPRY